MRSASLAALVLGLLLANSAAAAPPAFEEADLTAKPSEAELISVYPRPFAARASPLKSPCAAPSTQLARRGGARR